MTRSSCFCAAEIGRETCARYDSLHLDTIKSDIAATESVWLANTHEIDEMAESNNVGSDGVNPSRFSWDNNPDINHKAYELDSKSALKQPSNHSSSEKVTEPIRLREMDLFSARREKSGFRGSGDEKLGAFAMV